MTSRRAKLVDDFIAGYLADFEQHGKAVFERVRDKNPTAYLRVGAELMPKEQHIAVNEQPTYANFAEAEEALAQSFVRIPEALERIVNRVGELLEIAEASKPPEREINRRSRVQSKERRERLRWSTPRWGGSTIN
jgi:hypothetical protein